MFNISKIQIESNSQPYSKSIGKDPSCVQYFKDTNRKQFTTINACWSGLNLLCSIFQRYKSKAIHNMFFMLLVNRSVVFNISKIQIESNSQQYTNLEEARKSCVQYFKDTNRKQFTTRKLDLKTGTLLCSIFQRYKSKAIHNVYDTVKITFVVVFNISKIQIESNSQLPQLFNTIKSCCVQYFKDTNRKQFTTVPVSVKPFESLCSIFQRYKSKAIHNQQMKQKT